MQTRTTYPGSLLLAACTTGATVDAKLGDTAGFMCRLHQVPKWQAQPGTTLGGNILMMCCTAVSNSAVYSQTANRSRNVWTAIPHAQFAKSVSAGAPPVAGARATAGETLSVPRYITSPPRPRTDMPTMHAAWDKQRSCRGILGIRIKHGGVTDMYWKPMPAAGGPSCLFPLSATWSLVQGAGHTFTPVRRK